jgi:hypothetical protein
VRRSTPRLFRLYLNKSIVKDKSTQVLFVTSNAQKPFDQRISHSPETRQPGTVACVSRFWPEKSFHRTQGESFSHHSLHRAHFAATRHLAVVNQCVTHRRSNDINISAFLWTLFRFGESMSVMKPLICWENSSKTGDDFRRFGVEFDRCNDL